MNKLKLTTLIWLPFLLAAFFALAKVNIKSVFAADTSGTLQMYEDSVKNSVQTGGMNLSVFVGGNSTVTDSAGKQSGNSLGVFDNILGAVYTNITTIPVSNPAAAGAGTSYVPDRGAFGTLSTLIGGMYDHRPASSIEYFADLGKNFGLIQPSYAATTGFGFDRLQGVLTVWKAFRDFAYVFFAIIFVLVGLAIMFRVKINPQTAISIQNAIPKIIIALLLVTFSYAIAGLVIDLMYVVFALMISILDPTKTYGLMSEGFAGGIAQAFSVFGFDELVKIAFVGGVMGTLVGGVIGFIPGALVGGAVGTALLPVIIAIIILIAVFKLFIELIKAYISIILLVMFAPLQIMLGALPIGVGGFGSWLKNLIANVMVFPAVGAMFLIINIVSTSAKAGGMWSPPFTSGANQIVGFIAFGGVLLLPVVPKMVKDAFQIKPFAYGSAIGEGMGPLTGTAAYIGSGVLSGGKQVISSAIDRRTQAKAPQPGTPPIGGGSGSSA
jgi:hypothetical protein